MKSYDVIIRDGFKHQKSCKCDYVVEIDEWIGGSFKKFRMRGFECPACNELTKKPIV